MTSEVIGRNNKSTIKEFWSFTVKDVGPCDILESTEMMLFTAKQLLLFLSRSMDAAHDEVILGVTRSRLKR